MLRDLPPESWAVYPHVKPGCGGAKLFFQKCTNSVEQANALIRELREKAPFQFVQGMVELLCETICNRQLAVKTWEVRGLVVTPYANERHTQGSKVRYLAYSGSCAFAKPSK